MADPSRCQRQRKGPRDDAKGFGFISRENGEDVFVQFRAIQSQGFTSLKEGQQVSLVVVQGRKGLQADAVEPM